MNADPNHRGCHAVLGYDDDSRRPNLCPLRDGCYRANMYALNRNRDTQWKAMPLAPYDQLKEECPKYWRR